MLLYILELGSEIG